MSNTCHCKAFTIVSMLLTSRSCTVAGTLNLDLIPRSAANTAYDTQDPTIVRRGYITRLGGDTQDCAPLSCVRISYQPHTFPTPNTNHWPLRIEVEYDMICHGFPFMSSTAVCPDTIDMKRRSGNGWSRHRRESRAWGVRMNFDRGLQLASVAVQALILASRLVAIGLIFP